MGLSAFSRARVSMLPEMELEAKRFDKWNKMHQAGVRDADDFYAKAEEDVEEIREAMLECVDAIGEKAEAGLAENTKEGDPIDLPLRLDHVRDLVGRRTVEDPQGEPKSTIERLHERIPAKAPASEAIAKKLDVNGAGPTEAELEAAAEEQKSWTDEEEELPAPGKSAGTQSASPGSVTEHKADTKVPPPAAHKPTTAPAPAKK